MPCLSPQVLSKVWLVIRSSALQNLSPAVVGSGVRGCRTHRGGRRLGLSGLGQPEEGAAGDHVGEDARPAPQQHLGRDLAGAAARMQLHMHLHQTANKQTLSDVVLRPDQRSISF
eukprot:3932190-Rhodomonas_salina.4